MLDDYNKLSYIKEGMTALWLIVALLCIIISIVLDYPWYMVSLSMFFIFLSIMNLKHAYQILYIGHIKNKQNKEQ